MRPSAAAATTTTPGTAAIASAAATAATAASQADPVGPARQLLLVTTPDWTSTAGTLRRFQRAAADQPWEPVGSPIGVSLGRSGLGWGRGRHGFNLGGGSTKAEGDGRAPAGVFALPEAFGYQDADSPGARTAKLPYRVATADLLCVDDPASTRYNHLVTRGEAGRPDWTSAEDMRRSDQQYALGIVVGHNAPPAVPGAGSCVFIHIWSSPGQPTIGCTAAAAADIAAIFFWLDAKADPVLVQLPNAEYLRLRTAWKLP